MAIIYTYPELKLSRDLAASDLMIISDISAVGKPTKSLKLKTLGMVQHISSYLLW